MVPDFLTGDAFSLVSLTTAINKLPYVPTRIADMGLFSSRGINTTTAIYEENNGQLSLIPSKARGEAGTQRKHAKRKVRSVPVPHFPYEDTILAESLRNVRAFGSENQAEGVASVVNDALAQMKQEHALTLEYLRLGAIKGHVIDGDGTTELVDLFTLFGITPPSDVNFNLDDDTADPGPALLGVKRTIEAALGAMVYDHVHCFCGPQWFDLFVAHPEVKYAYQYFEDGDFLRSDSRRGFKYKDIIFEEYRGKIGTEDFIDESSTPVCHFFPVGVPGLFETLFAPADFMETVNTVGLPVYAKQANMKFDRGVEIHTQSNPLCVCTRPGVLVKGTSS